MLKDYRKTLKRGEAAESRSKIRGTKDGKLLGPCFGKTTVQAIAEGKPVPKVPKPSMSRLRIMATDEWHCGASRRIDRECVHIRDIPGGPVPGGFMVLRFRAPRHSFKREHKGFLAFLGSFEPAVPAQP